MNRMSAILTGPISLGIRYLRIILPGESVGRPCSSVRRGITGVFARRYNLNGRPSRAPRSWRALLRQCPNPSFQGSDKALPSRCVFNGPEDCEDRMTWKTTGSVPGNGTEHAKVSVKLDFPNPSPQKFRAEARHAYSQPSHKFVRQDEQDRRDAQ